MFSRALLLALCCACAASLTPLSAAGDDNECALYLAGPGRTSAYDYSLNLLKGNFGYEGQHTCITYDAVNQAYLEARNRIVVSQPKGDWKPEDFASVGELILDISINLARTYGLTYEEIEKGLPLIDTSRTLIREVCPPVFSHVECRAGKYRRLDGLCNNLNHPTWGATNAPFQRLIGPLFADGINAPRIAHTGRDLPLSRVVSRTMHPDDGFHDHAGTVMVIAWGQFMDHDYTLTGTPLDPVNRNDPEECCKRPLHLKHPYCNEILVPEDDYFYRLFGVKCIDFVRGFPSPRPGCRLGSRVPFNTLTGVIDGNTVYGVTDKFARKLRTGYGGLLRMNPVFKEYGLKDLLPLKLDIPDEGCTRPNKNMYCFEAGEIRVNEQLVLTVMHTLMAREHNRVAKALAEVNPHWDDETLYQEARRINIAEIQHITYNEFLPILLGKDVMEKFGLVLEKDGYWDGYDPEVNPDVIASFAAAAYRFGHSLLPTAVERWSKAHKFIASKRLSDLIRRPYDLYRAGVMDEYVMGLMNQVAQAMDDSITQEVTNHLFKKVGARFGMDLVSFNMQRGREFGLPGYMEFRKFCGLPGAETFQDLFGTMSNSTVRKYETIFEHPIDVDLWSGGVSERPLPGSMLGPTFACIIATQFSYSRRGDRFWYELPNQPSTFTPEQLAEVRKARLARVICDNTDIIDTVQLYPMVLPDHELNPRVPCRSGIIPSMDFTKWAEPAPFQGAAKQFMTDAYIVNKTESNCTKESSNAAANVSNDTQNTNDTLLEDSNCNITNAFNPTTKDNLVTLHIAGNITSNNNENSSSINHGCGEDTKNMSAECIEKLSKINMIPKSDTVLKYVYKKNDDKSIVKTKNPGHPLNSLRKKRSVETKENLEILTTESTRIAPLIVDYKTIHTPQQSQYNDAAPLHQRLTENTVQNSALADFNIVTLHEPGQLLKKEDGANPNAASESGSDEERKASTENETSNEDDSNSDSAESSEEENHPRKTEKPHSDYRKPETFNSDGDQSNESEESRNSSSSNEESDEKNVRTKAPYRDTERSIENEANDSSEVSQEIVKNSDLSKKLKDSYERYDHHPRKPVNNFEKYEDNPRKVDGSFEKYVDNPKQQVGSFEKYEDKEEKSEPQKSDKNTESTSSQENSESKERYENNDSAERDEILNDNIEQKYDNESNENSKKAKLKNHDDSGQSKENSYETNRETYNRNEQTEKYDIPTEHPKHLSTPSTIQDVDLGDFSYVRIQVNDKGQIVPSIEGENADASVSKPKNDETDAQKYQISSPDIDEELKSDIYDSIKQPIRVNGEIKPVVEIHNENTEGDTSSENSKISNPENDVSLETLLDTKEKYQSQKHSSQDKQEDNGDVKQQFERIPKNYKHNDEKDEGNKNSQETQEEAPSKGDDGKEVHNEGTLDTFTPKEINFDDHLKYKFSDISIKLPEIKLPDDILAYAYVDPYEKTEKYKSKNKKNSNKGTFYHYGPEIDSDEDVQKHKKDGEHDDNDHNDDHGYHEYYGPQISKYQKKKDNSEEHDEHEDLYEKFVRERFGKQGTFEKRSEKLQDVGLPYNPKLFENVQNILQQTKKIDEQAKKSGDPNAAYKWTLEYGEKL